jgi:hypothetical protein
MEHYYFRIADDPPGEFACGKFEQGQSSLETLGGFQAETIPIIAVASRSMTPVPIRERISDSERIERSLPFDPVGHH